MSSEATRSGRWFKGLQAGCERLLHPSVAVEKKAQQRRLLSVLLAGPFVSAPLVAQAFAPAFGLIGSLAALCASFGLSWLIALYVSARGRAEEAEFAALGLAAVMIATAVALSGGMATPAAMLLAAIPFEAFWVSRNRKGAALGAAAAATAAVVAAMSLTPVVTVAGSAAWLWLSPVLYGATVAFRFFYNPEAGAEAEEAAAQLPETCFDAVVVRLGRNGEAMHVSDRAEALLDLEPTLLLGTGLFDRIHVADRVAFMCAASSVRETGAASRCTIRLRRPATEGSLASIYRPFEAEFVRANAHDGVVSVLLRDGSETASLRDELAVATEKAGATEVAKGRFLAAVSHELRTPLNAIIGFSDMLLHRQISGDMTEKQAEHVAMIREAGNHLLSVVNAILDVSKIESGSYQITVEPFNLKPTAQLCCAMLDPQAQDKGVSLAVKVPEELGEVMGDQRAVQQILINLVSNAIKFTPAGGSVSVSAVRTNEMVRIFVNDNGIGIAPDDLASLGQPFRQVQNDYTRQFQGTGLGLSLVKGLVKLHGGTMTIESAPGLGTTVMVGLPAAGNDGKSIDGTTEDNDGIALRKTA